MGAGAKSEAIRLVESANQLIVAASSGGDVADAHTERIRRALDHGLSRRVDHRVRETHIEAPGWYDLTADEVDGLVANEAGMLVVLGSHPNGRIREAAVHLAQPIVEPTDPNARKPPAGVTRMLAQRSLDPTPPVREAAISLVAALFRNELRPEFSGRMPTGVERAAREIVAQSRAVVRCPQLVEAALDLFACRIGRYSVDGVRDHHQHTLTEVDRREQVLAELRRLVTTLDDEAQIAAGNRLIEFYERSLRPVRADDEGAVIDPASS
ncbi:MAG: hypothetical protein R2733_23990 [Acidimicrobiales bacterium]